MQLSLLVHSSLSSNAAAATQIIERTTNNLKLKTEITTTRMMTKGTRMVRNSMRKSFAMNSKCQTTIASKMGAGTGSSNRISTSTTRTRKSSASS